MHDLLSSGFSETRELLQTWQTVAAPAAYFTRITRNYLHRVYAASARYHGMQRHFADFSKYFSWKTKEIQLTRQGMIFHAAMNQMHICQKSLVVKCLFNIRLFNIKVAASRIIQVHLRSKFSLPDNLINLNIYREVDFSFCILLK